MAAMGPICDIHDVPEACLYAVPLHLGGWGYPWGYRLYLGGNARYSEACGAYFHCPQLHQKKAINGYRLIAKAR